MWLGLNIFPLGDGERGDIVSYNSTNNKHFGNTLMFVFLVAFSAERREKNVVFYAGSNKGQWPMKMKMNY